MFVVSCFICAAIACLVSLEIKAKTNLRFSTSVRSVDKGTAPLATSSKTLFLAG